MSDLIPSDLDLALGYTPPFDASPFVSPLVSEYERANSLDAVSPEQR